ncbi:MAG: T9SS type A sorting domain-containing protein, partial [Candidatus Hermodarchaeia archaeon]
GLKPLSRWEKPLTDDSLELLRQTGLLTKQIRRTVKTGKEVIETIFSRLPAYLGLYEQRFGDKPIDKSAQTLQFEGFLFGYPPCCVKEYIRKPYAPNNLEAEEQKILFHWACRDCKITPVLLDAYKSICNSLNSC